MTATNIARGYQTFKPLDADEAVDGVQLGAQLRGQLKVNGLLTPKLTAIMLASFKSVIAIYAANTAICFGLRRSIHNPS